MNTCVFKLILHKKKAIFIQLLESPIPHQDDHLQPRKGHEKRIFETLHNEIKCVLSVKESNFKNQNFHFGHEIRIFIPKIGQNSHFYSLKCLLGGGR